MNRIREIRTSKDLTQEELAIRVGTTQPTIDRLEKGERKLTEDWMRKIATALEVTPADLIQSPTIAEFRDEASVYLSPSAEHLLKPLRGKALAFMTVTTDSLLNLGIKPGDVRLFDLSPEAVAGVKTGDVVVAQLYDPHELLIAKTVIRQFIAPCLLTTNRPTTNVAFTLVNANFEAAIKGVMAPDTDDANNDDATPVTA